MMNEKYKVFRVVSCTSTHDGNINIMLQKIVNNADFSNVILIEKILNSSFGATSLGDFFCMVKTNGIWEFAE